MTLWLEDAKRYALVLLSHRRLPLWLALLAALLTLPSLGVGLFLDDYQHKLVMQDSDSPLRALSARWDLFRFLDGDPRQNAELVDYGVLPWWTDVRVKGAFWRPITSLTHWLDYILWPDSPALMHAQSVAWYALLVAIVALFYRRMMGTGVTAGLAALLYSVDAAHSMPIAFLANRNSLIAAFLGVLCLSAHDRWRRHDWRAGAVIAPLLLALALLAKEEAIAICAYLAAFAICIDAASWRRRVATLIPYALVVIVWRIAWVYLGYGVSRLGLYVDPLEEPARFAVALIQRAPLLLLGQLSTVPPELSMFWGESMRLSLIAYTLLAAIAAVILPLLRSQPLARFWLAGMILSLVPACTTFPSDRMLLFAGIGAMGLLSQFIVAVFSGETPLRPVLRVASRGLAWTFVALHILLAPVVLLARTSPVSARRLNSLCLRGPLDHGVEAQDLVVVNPPSVFGVMSPAFMWAAEHAPIPRHLRVLTSTYFHPVKLQRTDERTLLVSPEIGFIPSPMDRLFSGPSHIFSAGQQLHFTGMDVEITAVTPAGRPLEAAFRFSVPLEDNSLRWLQWKHGEFQAFTPPPVGASVILTSDLRKKPGNTIGSRQSMPSPPAP